MQKKTRTQNLSFYDKQDFLYLYENEIPIPLIAKYFNKHPSNIHRLAAKLGVKKNVKSKDQIVEEYRQSKLKILEELINRRKINEK